MAAAPGGQAMHPPAQSRGRESPDGSAGVLKPVTHDGTVATTGTGNGTVHTGQSEVRFA